MNFKWIRSIACFVMIFGPAAPSQSADIAKTRPLIRLETDDGASGGTEAVATPRTHSLHSDRPVVRIDGNDKSNGTGSQPPGAAGDAQITKKSSEARPRIKIPAASSDDDGKPITVKPPSGTAGVPGATPDSTGARRSEGQPGAAGDAQVTKKSSEARPKIKSPAASSDDGDGKPVTVKPPSGTAGVPGATPDSTGARRSEGQPGAAGDAQVTKKSSEARPKIKSPAASSDDGDGKPVTVKPSSGTAGTPGTTPDSTGAKRSDEQPSKVIKIQ